MIVYNTVVLGLRVTRLPDQSETTTTRKTLQRKDKLLVCVGRHKELHVARLALEKTEVGLDSGREFSW